MANATYSTGIPVNYGSCALTLDIYETTDAANNVSHIRGILTLSHSGSGSPFNNSGSSASMTIAGNNFYWSGGYNLPGNSSLTLLDNTVYNIGHNANGEGSVSVSGSFSGQGNFPIGSGSTSGTYTMANFDRKPDAPTSVTSTLNADKSITVTSNAVSSPAGTATYYVSYSSNGGSTWSSYTTIPSNARSYTYALGTLPMGQNYRFRMYATNSDGTSGTFTQSTDLFLPAGGKRYDGSSWNSTLTAKRYDGASWVTLTTAKRYNGTDWINLS